MSEPQSDPQDSRWSALSEWRQRLINSGDETADSLKERQLRMVLQIPRTEVHDIRALLPGLARHAEAIAAILSRSRGEHPGLSVVPDPDPPAAPTAPRDPTESSGPEPHAHQPLRSLDREPFAGQPPPPRSPDPPRAAPADLETDFARHRATALPATPAHRVSGRSSTHDGSRQLTWLAYIPDADSGPTVVVVYRLVSSDENPPYSPDHARLVAASTGTSAMDDEPHTAAVRHYQVWVNSGATRAEALAAQPQLHAHASVVGLPTGVSIRDDSGQIVGHWDTPHGATAVWICRLPAGADSRHAMQYRILAEADNLTGFVDSTVARGASYRYRLYTEAMVAGQTLLSDPLDTDVTVSAVLEPVTDMAVTNSGGGAVELTWPGPAAGKVRIYRTANRPNDISGAIAQSALDQAGLTTDLQVTRPVAEGPGGRIVMRGVSWPDAWSRVYFTPVTVLGDLALMGTPVSTVRVGTIGDVDLAEYCNLQVLTFEWPAGASSVELQTAPRNYDPQQGLTGRPIDIVKENYEKYGGHLLAGRDRLPPTGCSLHVAAIAHSGGRRIRGPWRSVDYPGMLRLKYRLMRYNGANGRLNAAVAIQSEVPVPRSPAFVLVHNPHRLPLSVDDGAALDVTPYDTPSRQHSGPPGKELRPRALTQDGGDERWIVDLGGLTGWVRLFFNSYDTRTMRGRALIDPAVDELWLGSASSPQAQR